MKHITNDQIHFLFVNTYIYIYIFVSNSFLWLKLYIFLEPLICSFVLILVPLLIHQVSLDSLEFFSNCRGSGLRLLIILLMAYLILVQAVGISGSGIAGTVCLHRLKVLYFWKNQWYYLLKVFLQKKDFVAFGPNGE